MISITLENREEGRIKLNKKTHAIAARGESVRGSIFSRAYQRVQSESLSRERIFISPYGLFRLAKDRAKDRKYARGSRC